MAMRSAPCVAALLVMASPALADSFGGFSGVDRPYLVDRDKLCQPLTVKDGAATGAPACEKATADVVARLSIKEPNVQRGIKASFAASASGRTLTVTRKSGEPVVTWNAPDVIGKVVEVYASQYEDRVAVAYTMRRLGKEVTEIVAFELVKTTGRDPSTSRPAPDPTTTPTPTPTPTTSPPTTPAPPADPKLDKALTSARKATGAKAVGAWQAVLAIDGQHSEARYRIAANKAASKAAGEAIGQLEALAKSTRDDAIEWLVEARFDKAFASLRADPKYRAAVGLDRPARTPYERLMGFGGQWEQTGTSCEAPEVRLVIARDRSFKLVVKSMCRGRGFEMPFKGTWRIADDGIVLVLPTKGKQASAKDEAPCTFEREQDEDALHCVLDRDLDFVVLPTRR
jgi:hypothetical protein